MKRNPGRLSIRLLNMASSRSLFVNYVIWLKELFYGEDFPESALPVTLECLRDALTLRFPKEAADLTAEYIEAALRKLFEPTLLKSFSVVRKKTNSLRIPNKFKSSSKTMLPSLL